MEGAEISNCIPAGTEQKIVTWNIGFGAYTQDFGFFMDGGKESWALSEEALKLNLERIRDYQKTLDADIYLTQEVDFDSTRTYYLDERPYVIEGTGSANYTFAQNWDSAFLFYPFIRPHGTARTGILMSSKYAITSSLRRSLPVETGIMKIVDLDRCYTVNRMAVSGEEGKELVVYNLHLSAYTSDGTISAEQMELLVADMQEEYEKGNYCIAGGDFNKDLSGDAVTFFNTDRQDCSWAQPIPDSVFEGKDIELIFPYDGENPVPSCREADGPWTHDPMTQFVVTVDGFMVSPNVEVVSSSVIDTDFYYSDHNPVEMTFILK